MITRVEIWKSGPRGTLMARLSDHGGLVKVDLLESSPQFEDFIGKDIYSNRMGRDVTPYEPQAYMQAVADMFVNSSYYFATVDEEHRT